MDKRLLNQRRVIERHGFQIVRLELRGSGHWFAHVTHELGSGIISLASSPSRNDTTMITDSKCKRLKRDLERQRATA